MTGSAVRPVVAELLERRVLLSDNNSIATARDLEPSMVGLQNGAQLLRVIDEYQATSNDDFFKFNLAAGQTASIALDGDIEEDLWLELRTSSNSLLATGVRQDGGMGDYVIFDFVAPNTGTYYLDVSAEDGDVYDVFVTRGAGIETGEGVSRQVAQDITGPRQVLGQFEAVGEIDYDGFEQAWLTDSISDGEFQWNINYDGSILENGNDAFDGGLVREGFPKYNYGQYEEDYQEIVLGPFQQGSLSIARKIFAPEETEGGFARFLEFVTNTSDVTVLHTLRISSDLGSDLATTLVGTSSGGATPTTADNWIVTDDADGSTDPSVVHVFASPDGQRPSAVSLSGDELSFSYDLTLAPGETKVIMHFAVQSHSRAAAIEKAGRLEALFSGALAGLSAAEKAAIINFNAGAGGDFYRVNVNAGDALSLTTATLDDEVTPGEELDLRIELYDPSGNLVASNDNGAPDGRNAVIHHTAGITGAYSVLVKSLTPGAGQYSLAIGGATGTVAGPSVTSTSVAAGATLDAFPTTFEVNFSRPLRTTGLLPGALRVNGVPASSVFANGTRLYFTISNAAAGNGTYAVELAAGASIDISGNPTQSLSTSFSVAGADLVVTAAAGPASVTVGQDMSLSWTVSNQGSKTGSADWFDYVYVSDDPVLGAGDQIILSRDASALSPLAPGQSYSVEQTLSLPAHVNAGARHLLFIANGNNGQAEAHSGNNVFAVPINIASADLAAVSATVPATIVMGQNITTSWTVRNQSPELSTPTSNWFDYVYFSVDATFGTGDTFLTNVARPGTAALAPGADYTTERSFLFNLSGVAYSGPGHLLFIANGNSAVGESTRTNNVFAAPVTVAAPDLVVDNFTAPPTVAFGQTFTASWTVRNAGDVAASSVWFDTIFLSADGVVGSGDVSFISNPSTPALPLDPGESHTFSASVTINSNLPAGDYNLIVRANNFGIGETNRGNNDFVIPITLVAPDISITGVTAPATVAVDEDFDISWTIRNSSEIAAGADWYDYIYLSEDALLNDNDERLTDRWAGDSTPLAGSAEYSATESVRIDSWQATAGQYYLIVKADASNAQRETDEINNTFVISILVDAPDLVITNPVAPTVVDHNQQIELSWTVTNTSTSASATQAGSDYIVISDDRYFDWDDYWLDEYWPGSHYPLSPGESYTANLSLTMWPDVPAGEKYLLIIADGDENVGERDERNNTAAIPITIQGPDMTVVDFTAPSAAIVGQSVPFLWTVENSGLFAAQWSWLDAVYISDDPKLNFDKDTFVGRTSFNASPLDPAAQYTQLVDYTIPTTELGERYFLLVLDSNEWHGETDRANNVVAVPVSLTAPDLSLSAATAPASALVGSSIPIEWDVKNRGQHAALGSWSDRIYLSVDTAFGNGDVLLGNVARPDTLEADASYTHSTAITIPANTAPGAWHLVFLADGGSQQGETDETNNSFSVPITLTGPDLIVTAAAGPASALLGSSVELSWTVHNNSAENALATSWWDAIYISSDTVLDSSDTFVNRRSHSHTMLAAGDSYTATQTVTLPATTPGNRYLLFTADVFQLGNSASNSQGETSETNNSFGLPIELIATDLIVNAHTAPSAGAANQPIDVSFTVRNQGTTPAPADWSDGVYLSTDNLFHTGDMLLANISAAAQSPLAAGASYTVNQSLNLPNVSAGSYFLLFVADRGNVQGETNESNNARSQAITISTPDLVPVSLDAPAAATAGQSFDVSWIGRNAGSVVAWGDWYDSVYFSADTLLSSSDTRLNVGYAGNASPVAAGADYTLAGSALIPANTEPGTYNLILAADRYGFGPFDAPNNNLQTETNENNNTLVVPIVVGTADLSITDASAPASATQDETISLSWTVANSGTSLAWADWSDSVYLSSDETLDDADALLVDRSSSDETPLDAGATYTVSANATVPAFADGPAFLLFVTDRSQNQPESDESNNATAVPIQIGSRDLTVTSVTGPASAMTGQQINVSWTLANSGSVDLDGSWTDSVYLSSDDAAGDDVLLADFPISTSLAAGQTLARTQSVIVPATPAGTYRLVVVTDSSNAVGEGSESNNAAVAVDPLVLSTAATPNLQVDEVTLAVTEVELGAPLTVRWTVSNSGNGATSSTFWRDYVYLSPDDQLDETDLKIGEAQNPSYLNAGESYASSAVAHITGVGEGDYYILVKTDATSPHRVNEAGGEDDNITVGPQIHVTLPPPPDMVVTSVQAPEIAFSGQPMAVTYRVVNNGTGPVVAGLWHDRIYLSEDQELDSGDRQLLQVQRNYSNSDSDTAPLDIEYQVTYAPTLPVDLTGTFYVFVLTDATNRIDEFAFELNNANHDATPVTINLTPPPDLEIESFAAPSTASAGRAFSINYTVTNFGATRTPNTTWSDAFFLSSDDVLDTATDLQLGTQGISLGEGLEAGASYARQRSLSTAPSLAAGQYYLFAITDIDNVVFELDNANNRLATPSLITISSDPPDLKVTSLSGLATATAGAALALNWTVANTGAGNTITSGWLDRVILSLDTVIGNGDDRDLGGFSHNGLLAAGASYTAGGTVQVPWDVAGSTYLYLHTDNGNQVFEGADEGNNTSTLLKVQVARDSSDLALNSAEMAQEGGRLRFNWSVSNLGPGTTAVSNWHDGIYLSVDDTVGNGDDVLLRSHYHGGRLEMGQEYAANALVEVPRTFSGLYHFYIAANASGEVDEGGQNGNNILSAGTLDTSTLQLDPDFVVQAVDAPAEAVAGQAVTIGWTVRNLGDAIPLDGPRPPELGNDAWRDNIYLSRDQIFDAESDIYLGQWATHRNQLREVVEGGQTFQQYQQAIDFTMPRGQTGTFYVFVLADRHGEVSETDESNNRGADLGGMFTSLAPPADLTVGTITIPAGAALGASFNLSYTLENLGANYAFGSWTDRLYLSVDPAFSTDDIPLITRTHAANTGDGFIPAGQSKTYSVNGKLTAAVPGDYYVVLRTDVFNTVVESDELNNFGASLTSFSVSVPTLDLSDGSDSRNVSTTVSDFAGPDTFYFAFDATAGQTIALDADWNFIDMDPFDPMRTERQTRTTSYVALDRIPSQFDYDFVEDSFLQSHSSGGFGNRLIIPRTESGTYYVRLDVADTDTSYWIIHHDNGMVSTIHPNSVEDFDLVATVLPFSIAAISPGRAGNSGGATFEVVSSGFGLCTEAQLLLGGQVVRGAQEIYLDPTDQSRAFVSFDMAGLDPGGYELRVVSESGASDVEAVQVTLGTGPNLAATPDGPASVRLDREYVFYVNYGNNGDGDGVAPLLLVENLDDNPFALSRHDLHDAATQPRMMQLMGIGQDGPAGILRPGAIGSIPVYFRTAPATGNWRVSTITADDPRLISSDALEAEIRPTGVDDQEWAIIRPRLEALIGGTWGSYVRALAGVATELASSGLRTPDVEVLFGALYLKARLGIGSPTAQGLVVGDPGCIAVPGATIRALSADGVVIETAVADDQSRYRFRELPPGIYDLVIDAAGYARQVIEGAVVPAGGALRLDIHLEPEAVITGTIDASALDPEQDEYVFTARVPETQATADVYQVSLDGDRFSVGGLPAGAYELKIRTNGFLVRTLEVVVGDGQTVDIGELVLTPAAAVSGTVAHARGAFLPPSLTVGVFDLAGGLVDAILAETDGSYSIPRLAAGTYVVRVAGLATGFSNEAQISVVEGQQVEDVNLIIQPGATVSGIVTNSVTGQPLGGAVVHITAADGSRIIAITELNGGYSVAGLPLGLYSVELQVTGPAARTQVEVTDLSSTVSVNLSIQTVATIRGRLTLASGEPLASGQVQLLRDGAVIAHVETDADGQYSIHLLQAGTYSLNAGIGDGTASFTAAGSFSVASGETIVRDFVAGTATADVSFAFAGSAFVTLSQVNGGTATPLTITEAAGGSIAFSNLAAGGYVVDVGAGRFGGSASFSVVEGGEISIDVPLTLHSTLAGTITDAGGTPIPNAIVALLNPLTGRRYITISREDGSYLFPRAISGHYDVSIFAAGNAPLVQTGVLVNGETTFSRSLAASAATVTGRLVDAAGRQLVTGNVTLLDSAGHVIGMAAVGADGQFVIDAAAAGLKVLVFAAGFEPVEVSGVSAGAMGDVVLEPLALVLVPVGAASMGSGGGGTAQLNAADVLRPTFWEAFFGDYVPAPAPTIGSLPSPVPIECVAELEAAEAMISQLQSLRQQILLAENNFDEYKSELVTLVTLESLAAIGKAAEVGLVIYQLGAAVTGATIQVGANGAIGTSALYTGLETAAAQALTHAQNLVSIISAAIGGIQSGIDATRAALAGDPQSIGDRIGAVVGLVTDILSNSTTIVTYLTQAAEKLSELASGVGGNAASEYLGKVGTILSAISAVNTIIQLLDGDGGEFYKESLRVYGHMTSYLSEIQQAVALYELKLAQYPAVLQALNECIAEHDDDPSNDPSNPDNPGTPNPNNPLGPPAPPPSPALPSPYDPQPIVSSDPNDIIGPAGFGEEGWIGAGSTLPYMIRFENQATASGAAQRVTITHQLDSDLDFRTFRVDDFGWGDLRIELPGNSGFHHGRVDLPDELGFDVDVTATIDTVSGLATWIIQAVDPATGDAPEDALLGFLPPNDANGSGEGFVTYTIKARRDALTATRIDAKATIIFDTNEPIDTPPIFNTLDAGLPASSVAALPTGTEEASFLVSWGGQDDENGSGITGYDIYVSDNGGAYTLWLGGTQLTEATFTGLPGHSYAFFSIAHDHGGNAELPPATADAQTLLAGFSDLVVNAGGDATLEEGGMLARSVFFDDPAGTGPWTATIDYGDGSEPQVLVIENSDGFQLSHLYPQDGTFTVTVTIANGQELVGSATFTASVANAAPEAIAGPDQAAGEGSLVSFGGSFTDAGTADTHTIIWDFGDGATAEGTLFPVHAYSDNGTYQVSLTVTDDSGGTSKSTMDVTVTNVAPTAAMTNGGPVGPGEAVTVSFIGSFDPSIADTAAGFTYSFDFDNDGTFDLTGAAAVVEHQFASTGAHIVVGRITDKDGAYTEHTTTVAVNGGTSAPVIRTLSATSPVDEGATVTLSGTFDDANLDDAFELQIGWGDGQTQTVLIAAGERTFAVDHVYADDPSGEDAAGFTINVTLTDSGYLSTTQATTAIVNNAAPTLAGIEAPPAQDGEAATLSGSIIKAGANDALTLLIDWGDGSEAESFSYVAGTSSFSESHTYPGSGTYLLTLLIEDDDGGSTQSQLEITVANAAPTATFDNDGPISEGGSATISFSGQSDSAADTAAGFSYAYDLDNDGVFEVTTDQSSVTHAFAASGTFAVRGRILDQHGAFSEYLTEIVVADVAPTLEVAGDTEVAEGAAYSLNLGAVNDPGADTVSSYTIHWGDGSSETFSGSPTRVIRGHVFSDGPAARTIRIDLTDDDGTHADAGTIAVTVSNLSPTSVLAGTDAAEGAITTVGFSGQADSSPDDAAAGFRYSFDLNNDGDFEDAGEIEDTDQAAWQLSLPDDGSYTVRGRIKDKDGGFTDYTTTLTITNAAPTVSIIGAPAAATEGDLLSLSSLVIDAGALDTFAYAWTVTKNGQTFASGSEPDFEFAPVDEGTYVVGLTVTDDDGAVGTAAAAIISVTNAAPTLAASATGIAAQYSDSIGAVVFTADDAGDDVLTATTSFSVNGGAFAAGLPAGTTLAAGPGADQWTLAGTADLAPGTYVIRLAVSDGDGGAATKDVTLTVTPENAGVNYTGTMLATTASLKSGKATIILAATIRDSSVLAAGDSTAGDVRNTRVTFQVYNAMTDALVTTITNIPVGLANSGNASVGTAAYEWAVDIGNADSTIYRVVAIVGDRYVGSSTGDFITVAKPIVGAINGSGFLVNSATAGLLAGDAGERTSFAFSVKVNKNGAPQGSVVMLVRRMEPDGIVHTYQVRSNAILTITTNPATGKAVFEAKATIQDVTFNGKPISVDGNALLRITLTDDGTTDTDSIGATLWRKDGGLYFSSLWDGIRTAEDELDGGDLLVS